MCLGQVYLFMEMKDYKSKPIEVKVKSSNVKQSWHYSNLTKQSMLITACSVSDIWLWLIRVHYQTQYEETFVFKRSFSLVNEFEFGLGLDWFWTLVR